MAATLALDQTQILTDAQVESLTESVHSIIGSAMVDRANKLNVDTASHLRFQAVAARCIERRHQRGLDVKAVAKRLGLRQYRVQAIEHCRLKEIRADVLRTYVSFLGLTPWLSRWIHANPELAGVLGLSPQSMRFGNSRRRRVAAAAGHTV